MQREGTAQRVWDEMDHIPRGDIPQNIFRSTYYSNRMNDLVLDPATPALETLWRVAVDLRKTNPSFSPGYDLEFFRR